MDAVTRRISAQDCAIALAACVLQVGVTLLAAAHHGRSVSAAAIALLVAGPVALLVRRRHPAAALAATFAVAFAYSALNYYPRGLVFVSVVVAFWTAMLHGHRRLGWLSILAGYVVFVIALPLAGAQSGADVAWVSGIAAWMLLLAAGAEIVRVRRERAGETALARAEQELRIAGEERLRIARELHDVLAHNLSLINVQASIALHIFDAHPDQSRTALGAIKNASKEALGELRVVLDILRAPGEAAPRTPSDGLARLEQLIARSRHAGLPVSAQVDGPPRRLPSGVDLAAYRIIQEALTNVTRHAPGAATEVHVSYGEHELVLQVDNLWAGVTTNGNSSGDGTHRNGLRGMRERAAELGGSLHAGPVGRGFRVRARLPVPPVP